MFLTTVFFSAACVTFLQNKQRTAHRHQVTQNSVVTADLKLIQASPDGAVGIGTDFTHSALSLKKPAQSVRQHDIGLPNISFQRRFPRPPYNYSPNKYVPGEDGTYAQNYQDIWLEQLASANGWLESQAANGFYLDLGAFKPLECSNSAKFDVEFGWRGIVVEPRSDMGFSTHRPNAIEVNRAISGTTGLSVTLSGTRGQIFNVDKGSQSGAKENQVRVTTINAADLIHCVNGTANSSVDCSGVRQRANGQIPTFINFVSVDVEGNEKELFSTWPWNILQVAAFIVETGAGQPGMNCHADCHAVRNILASHGYVNGGVDNAGVDEYFVLPQYWRDSLRLKDYRVHPPRSAGCRR